MIKIGEKIAFVDERFLSYTIDLSYIIGEDWWHPDAKKNYGLIGKHKNKPFDFNNRILIDLLKGLSPAILRIGGSKSDEILYGNDNRKNTISNLSLNKIHNIFSFSKKIDAEILFTLNAGKLCRDKKIWISDNLKILLDFINKKNIPLKYFEFGNEPNGFFIRGLSWKVSAKQYAQDFLTCKRFLIQRYPHHVLIGPGCMFFRKMGDITQFQKKFLKNKAYPDIISWHFYPFQSSRSPINFKKITPYTFLKPKHLDRSDKWVKKNIQWKQKFSPHSDIWISETSNALCGGQPGVSNTFASCFWWLDFLGKMARYEQKVIIRQSAIGGDYSLIDDATLLPNPDYWASLLWKKLMGKEVYETNHSNKYAELRIYAHSSTIKKKKTILVINMRSRKKFIFKQNKTFQYFTLSSDSLKSTDIYLNGYKLTYDNKLPDIFQYAKTSKEIIIQPREIAFILC